MQQCMTVAAATESVIVGFNETTAADSFIKWGMRAVTFFGIVASVNFNKNIELEKYQALLDDIENVGSEMQPQKSWNKIPQVY